MGDASFPKPVIGIVGGVGSGKSTAASEFAALGCEVIDGDAIGHQLLADSDVRRRLRERWGEAVFRPDGSVDRKALASIVFCRVEELQAINAILHPLIRACMERRIAEGRSRPGVAAVIVDAAVLFEAGWDDLCTSKVFVSAPLPQRAQRVKASRGWDERILGDREKTQISLDSKAAKCEYKLDNSSSVSHLREQVRKIFNEIVHVADRP